MTLILSTITKNAAYTSTDTKYSNFIGDTVIEAPKSVVIECRNGKFILSYTGDYVNVSSRGYEMLLADWITEFINTEKRAELNIDPLVEQLIDGLEKLYSGYHKTYSLIVVLAGWTFEGDKVYPVVFTISNCFDFDYSSMVAARVFSLKVEVVDVSRPHIIPFGAVTPADSAMMKRAIENLESQLKDPVNSINTGLVTKGLQAINKAARMHPKKGKYVGANVITAAMPWTAEPVFIEPWPKPTKFEFPSIVTRHGVLKLKYKKN